MSDYAGDSGGGAVGAAVAGFPAASNAGVRALATQLRARRVPFVMATVVRAEPPTSAKAGDVAVVHPDGRIEGFVGGECAEASVQLQAMRALESGQPMLLRISPDAPASGGWDAGAGSAEPAHGSLTVHNPCLSGGMLEIFLEPELPPPVMVVYGRSPIARALAALAERAGYVIGQSTAGPEAGEGEPEPDVLVAGAAAVVVASHGRGEEAILMSALRAGVGYVGLVASRRRGAAVLDMLELDDDAKARIHTPAGLDIGARKPEEVAVSILAEIIATRPKAPAAPEAIRTRGADGGGVPTATDPVCGMSVADVPGAPSAEHEGHRYLFCGSGCREAFVAEPEGFLARP